MKNIAIISLLAVLSLVLEIAGIVALAYTWLAIFPIALGASAAMKAWDRRLASRNDLPSAA